MRTYSQLIVTQQGKVCMIVSVIVAKLKFQGSGHCLQNDLLKFLAMALLKQFVTADMQVLPIDNSLMFSVIILQCNSLGIWLYNRRFIARN